MVTIPEGANKKNLYARHAALKSAVEKWLESTNRLSEKITEKAQNDDIIANPACRIKFAIDSIFSKLPPLPAAAREEIRAVFAEKGIPLERAHVMNFTVKEWLDGDRWAVSHNILQDGCGQEEVSPRQGRNPGIVLLPQGQFIDLSHAYNPNLIADMQELLDEALRDLYQRDPDIAQEAKNLQNDAMERLHDLIAGKGGAFAPDIDTGIAPHPMDEDEQDEEYKVTVGWMTLIQSITRGDELSDEISALRKEKVSLEKEVFALRDEYRTALLGYLASEGLTYNREHDVIWLRPHPPVEPLWGTGITDLAYDNGGLTPESLIEAITLKVDEPQTHAFNESGVEETRSTDAPIDERAAQLARKYAQDVADYTAWYQFS